MLLANELIQCSWPDTGCKRRGIIGERYGFDFAEQIFHDRDYDRADGAASELCDLPAARPWRLAKRDAGLHLHRLSVYHIRLQCPLLESLRNDFGLLGKRA